MNKEIIRENPEFLSSRDTECFSDIPFMIEILKKDGSRIEVCPSTIRSNMECVEAAISSYPLAYDMLDESLKSDYHIIETAYNSAKSAIDRIKADPKFNVFSYVDRTMTEYSSYRSLAKKLGKKIKKMTYVIPSKVKIK